ncbi:MAG: radical SAM protein [Candidatus Bathyarchaeia archaeon]
MVEILLTADRTMMSNYHGKEFLGFATSAPPNVIPDWLFKIMFFPPIKNKEGFPFEAPYGLRKVEAKLLDEGFEVLTVDPDHLAAYIDDAKVLGVHVMDPFGLGPSSTTFSRILRTGESYLSKYFRLVFMKPEVRKARRRGLRIIVGGPGVWQFKHRPEAQEAYGIDCIVDGESERILPHIFRTALNGGELPKYYEVPIYDAPSLEEISDIKNPSVNGLIEIGRGCPRGCSFCSVTLKSLRWYPLDKIEREIKVNVKNGVTSGLLHAEDVLLYGSSSVIPNRDRVLALHGMVKRYYRNFSWSHASIAAIASDPRLIGELHEILIDGNQTWWGAEIGIETGSPRLLKEAMPAKAKPFRPEEWPNIVKEAAGAMMDNRLIPACTLITGLPQEREEDTLKTLELIEDLKWFRSLIVPLFFVPMGRLRDKDWFKFEELTELQKELMVKCLGHDLRWAREMLEWYLEGRWYAPVLGGLYRIFIWLLERRGREARLFELEKGPAISVPPPTLSEAA